MSETKPIQSLLRGIDIIEMLCDAPHGLRLSDIAEAMNLKTPTVHNLVKTLVSRGLVEKLVSNQYAIGPRLPEMSERIRTNQQHAEAETAVRAISELKWKPIVNFNIVSGNRLVVRLRMTPDRPNLMQYPVGQISELYSSGTGLACLAFGSEEQVNSLKQANPFHDIGIRLWNSYNELDDFLEDAREKGYAATNFEKQDLYRVAVPIFDEDKQAIAYLGLAVPTDRIKKESDKSDMVKQLLNIAKKLQESST